MKKTRVDIAIYLCSVFMIIVIGIGLALEFGLIPKPKDSNSRTTYVIPPKICRALFWGAEPETFFDEYYPFYESCEDFREHATIDRDGNLVLRLTTEQKEAFIDFGDSGIEETRKTPGIYISKDLKELTLTGYEEDVKEIIWNKLPLTTVFDMASRQLINGVEPSKISVTVKIVDIATGETVYKAVWPEESFEFVFEDLDFTNRPTTEN